MTKILYCGELYYPSIGGVQKHLQIISEYSVSKGFDAEIATTVIKNRNFNNLNKIKINEFNISGNFIKGYSGDILDYQNFLLKRKFDIILFYAAQQWTFDLALPILHLIKGKKIFLPCGFSKFNNYLYYPYYSLLKKKILNINKVICFSKKYQDYIILKKYHNIDIIPNGGSKSKIKKILYKDDILRILNVSNMNYSKNQIMILIIMFFIKRKVQLSFIFSKKNLYFYLFDIFFQILKLLKKNINIKYFINLSQAEILNHYKKNDLFLFTSKIECSPIVILDSLNNNLNFISYDVGNVKELSKKYKIGFVTNSLTKIIKLITLYNKKKKINIKHYPTWDKSNKKYLDIFKKIKNF